LFSDSVGGADESRNGFSNRIPVKVTARFAMMIRPLYGGSDVILRSEATRDLHGSVNDEKQILRFAQDDR
jgi:hypothetical protein